MLQRIKEAWLVLSGQRTLTLAWQAGHDHGTMMEYRRIVLNGGDLVPVLDVLRALDDHFAGGPSSFARLNEAYRYYQRWRWELQKVYWDMPKVGHWPGSAF